MIIRSLLRAEAHRQRTPLLAAGVCGAVAATASVALLGLSGWFITGAALAGAAGSAAAFNYMLPAATIRLFAILRTGGRYGERLEGHRAALLALAGLRPALFARLAAGPPARALALSMGEGSARIIQDVDALESRVVRRPALIASVFSAFAAIGLATLAGPLPVSVMAALVMAGAGGAFALSRSQQRAGVAVQAAIGRLKHDAGALLQASVELRAYGLQAWAQERIAQTAAALDLARAAAARAAGRQAALAALASGGGAALVLLASGGAPLPFAVLASLAAAAGLEGATAFGRLLAEDGAAGEAERRLELLVAPPPAENDADGVEEDRLPAVPLHLAPGLRVAIVGRSGAGKTALLQRLLGLRAAKPGEIRIDQALVAGGKDRRRLFAYAPQEPTLLSGTVRENLLLGCPEADDSILWHALHDAALDERVGSLREGLDNWIGDGGERLSGGEQRRLCLARALVSAAPILVLDEPTEGLDRATESLVVERLEARLARTGQALLLVSHRKAPLALCARVLTVQTERPPRTAAA